MSTMETPTVEGMCAHVLRLHTVEKSGKKTQKDFLRFKISVFVFDNLKELIK